MQHKPQPFKAVWQDRPFTNRNGEPIELRGYCLTNAKSGRFVSDRPHEFFPLHVYCMPVAGVAYRPQELQSHEFDPGRPVTLRTEPDNPADPNAVGIWDAAGTQQVGYIPRGNAREIAHFIRAGRDIRGVVMREKLDANHHRVGLTVIVGPSEAAKVPWSQLTPRPE